MATETDWRRCGWRSYLCPEPYNRANLEFLEQNNIQLLQCPMEGNKVRLWLLVTCWRDRCPGVWRELAG